MTTGPKNPQTLLTPESVLTLPEGLTRDAGVTGFACEVGKGVRTFYFLYKHKGSPRRINLGRLRDRANNVAGYSFEEMKGKAIGYRARLDTLDDYDPAGEQIAQRKAEREAKRHREIVDARSRPLEAVFEEYLADMDGRVGGDALRPRTREGLEASFRVHILPALGALKLESLTPADIEGMFRAASKKRRTGRGKEAKTVGGKIAANRALAYLSTFLTWCVGRELIAANPVRTLAARKVRHAEEGRERFLSPEEWAALEQELDVRPYRESVPVGPRGKGRKVEERMTDTRRFDVFLSCEALRLALLTGCRKSEALGARWEHLDLEAGEWNKPAWSVKQKRTHSLQLSQRAIERLRALRAAHADPVFVFPSKARLAELAVGRVPRGEDGGHQADVKSIWRSIPNPLGIPDVPIHDLRHSHASAAINSGVDLFQIKDLLGHSSIRVTERYTHGDKGRQRATVDVIADYGARAKKA